MTTTPRWALKRRATWALLLLYFFPMDMSTSSSSRGGLFKFTLKTDNKLVMCHCFFYQFCNFLLNFWRFLLTLNWNEFHPPGCISGGANGAVADNHDAVFETELHEFWLCKIRMTFNLQVRASTELTHVTVEGNINHTITVILFLELAFSIRSNDSWFQAEFRILQFTFYNLIWLCGFSEISQGHLVGHRLVLEARFIQQKLQLSAVEVWDPEGLHQASIYTGLQSLWRRKTDRDLSLQIDWDREDQDRARWKRAKWAEFDSLWHWPWSWLSKCRLSINERQ